MGILSSYNLSIGGLWTHLSIGLRGISISYHSTLQEYFFRKFLNLMVSWDIFYLDYRAHPDDIIILDTHARWARFLT